MFLYFKFIILSTNIIIFTAVSLVTIVYFFEQCSEPQMAEKTILLLRECYEKLGRYKELEEACNSLGLQITGKSITY